MYQNNPGRDTNDESSKITKRKPRKKPVAIFAIVGVLVGAVAVIFYFTSFDTAKPNIDPAKFSFSSKKVVDVGVPNTVIFDYDATAAKPSDSVFIQQSWDKRLSRLVARDQRQHTSIYYYPGFFQAKLRVNDQIVKQHDLFIKSNGWLPLVDVSPVPVYFKPGDIVSNGVIGLPLDKIISNNIDLQPKAPWVGYYNVGDFGDIVSDDFVFETEVKNEYSEGSAACQHTEVHVLFEGAAMVIPLSIPGCVSELSFGDMSGKKLDLSRLGVAERSSQPTATTVRPSACAASIVVTSAAGRGRSCSASSDGRPTSTSCPSTMPRTPRPARLTKPVTRSSLGRIDGCGHGAGDRVLRGVLDRRRVPKHLVSVLAGCDQHLADRHRACGDRTGLVQHHRVDRAGGLQRLRALDQDAELGAATGTDHQCASGRGAAERARAGDDQEPRPRRWRPRPGRRRSQPEPKVATATAMTIDETPERFGQPLSLRLAGLRVLDQPGHLGELVSGTRLRGANDQAAADVGGGADHAVALGRPRPVTDSPVSIEASTAELPCSTMLPSVRDRLAGPNHEDRRRRSRFDQARSVSTPSRSTATVLGAELEQGPESGSGPPPGLDRGLR